MFRELGFVSIFIVYMTVQLGNAQEKQARFVRKAGMECLDTLAAKPEDCCKLPMLFEESIITKCKADFGTTEPLTPPSPGAPLPGCCVSECILNTTKILVDGKYDKSKALTVIKASTTDSKWVDVITKALDTCEKEQNDMKDKPTGPPPPSDSAIRKCHPVSGEMLACIMGNMFQNCPDYSSQANCATLKTQIAACPIALMKQH